MSQLISTLDHSMPTENDTAAEMARRVSGQAVIRIHEPLAKRTTLRVGGPADIFAEPASENDLAGIIRFCQERKLPFFVLGRGSNVLVKDGGFRGVVISLSQPHFSRIEIIGDRLHCGAGAKLKLAAVEARRNSLAGLEFLEGIPGTIGGGLRMNAGAMGGSMFGIVESLRLMDLTGIARDLPAAGMKVEYRNCETLKTHIALGAVLIGNPDQREEIELRMQEFSHKRWASQPAAPSAGCMFKNPVTIPAGKLVDELGLKGTGIGGARVSLEHGNFIVNDGTATARDVLELIELIRERASAQRGIQLETEVEIVGE
jgi:UDP-N-acetylenolpyruvoylglucosamine reductase